VVGPGETREFPVVYTLAAGLDERITNVTIRYSLFEIEEGAEPSAEQKRIEAEVLGGGAIVTPGYEKKAE
jgi:cytochrome c oxidase assembly protein Cox11